ncbi:hypothetical protein ACVI1J_003912 [Bradyrhizobium diazoefficiens]
MPDRAFSVPETGNFFARVFNGLVRENAPRPTATVACFAVTSRSHLSHQFLTSLDLTHGITVSYPF